MHPQLRVNRLMFVFLTDTFSLRLRGMGAEGTVLPLLHTTHTHNDLEKMCTAHLHMLCWHANIFTDSQSTAGSAVGLEMKPDSRKKKPVAAELYRFAFKEQDKTMTGL